jgi:hypothetical protein
MVAVMEAITDAAPRAVLPRRVLCCAGAAHPPTRTPDGVVRTRPVRTHRGATQRRRSASTCGVEQRRFDRVRDEDHPRSLASRQAARPAPDRAPSSRSRAGRQDRPGRAQCREPSGALRLSLQVDPVGYGNSRARISPQFARLPAYSSFEYPQISAELLPPRSGHPAVGLEQPAEPLPALDPPVRRDIVGEAGESTPRAC